MAKKGQEVVENTTESEVETNEDGFQKGQEVNEKDYFKFIAEQRNQSKD